MIVLLPKDVTNAILCIKGKSKIRILSHVRFKSDLHIYIERPALTGWNTGHNPSAVTIAGEGNELKGRTVINPPIPSMILEVLKRNQTSWSSFHNFKDKKTQISFKWEDDTKQRLLIYIGKYSKMLNFAQTEILRMLLEHIIQEKIEFATISNLDASKNPKRKSKEINESNQLKSLEGLPTVKESVEHNENEVISIKGVIEGETEKALLIQFENNKEVWIPKSVVRSNYNSINDISQNFIIDNWILKKNNISKN